MPYDHATSQSNTQPFGEASTTRMPLCALPYSRGVSRSKRVRRNIPLGLVWATNIYPRVKRAFMVVSQIEASGVCHPWQGCRASCCLVLGLTRLYCRLYCNGTPPFMVRDLTARHWRQSEDAPVDCVYASKPEGNLFTSSLLCSAPGSCTLDPDA